MVLLDQPLFPDRPATDAKGVVYYGFGFIATIVLFTRLPLNSSPSCRWSGN